MTQPSGTSLTAGWLAGGGTAYNGMSYGPPASASAWGLAGCPLAPRLYRSAFGELLLPPAICSDLGVPRLTLADSGQDVWLRRDQAELSAESRQELSAFLYDLEVPEEGVAIPGGVPISWLTALPIIPRLRNALRRHYLGHETDEIIVDPIDCKNVLRIRQVGKTALIEMLCVLESAELGLAPDQMPTNNAPKFKVITDAQFEAAVSQAARRAILDASLVAGYVREFATWALAETDAKTLGEAISRASEGTKPTAQWQRTTGLKLTDVGKVSPHPYDIVETWASGLSEREAYIFNNRIGCLEGAHTLQELAGPLGITRERVRQLEKKVLAKFMKFTRGGLASPIRWRIDTIKHKVGVAAPAIHVERLFKPLDGQTDYRSVLLRFAGPYEVNEGWVVLISSANGDPTAKIRSMTDDIGFIDPQLAAQELNKWGLDSSYHEEWLTRDASIRRLNGRLVRWDGTIGDKLVIGLADLGHPATVDALLDHIQEDRARTSANNALSPDPRVMKANQTEWALVSWGFPEYSGIAVEIGELLEQEGQPMLQQDIASRLYEDFGTSERSVRAYCQVPMFISRNGWVGLRGEDEPFEYPNRSPRNAKGVFVLGPQRVGILFEVDQDTLRGSGRALTMAAGATLDVRVGEVLAFKNETGDSVTITLPGTSLLGPSRGSIRSFAESSHAKSGDHLCLILDRSDMSAIAIITDVSQHESGWPLVARLTGIEADSGMNGLSAALGCREGEVRVLLKSRGDEVVEQALPASGLTSSGLNEALDRLEAQLQQQ